jgi:hypothetical protein
MVVWSGQLPTKNLTLEKATLRLEREEAIHTLLCGGDARSAYYHSFLQGATLTPRPLWNVEVDSSSTLNVAAPRLKTADRAYQATKEERWKVRLRGPVETEFLFFTVIGEDLLPFLVRGFRMCVLPVVVDSGRFHMVGHDEILAMGFDKASDWVKKAENVWHSRAVDRSMSAQQRLDYQHLLTVQRPRAPHIVIYNTSGTNISAAYLPLTEQRADDLALAGFVADTVTYYFYPSSEAEAHYLVGVLNSNVVNEAIKPYQPEGVYHGKRHIHRRPFEVCPIEQFDSKNSLHKEIAGLARAARLELADFKLEGSLAKAREAARERVRKEIAAIDVLVAQMFRPAPITVRKQAPRPQRHMFSD